MNGSRDFAFHKKCSFPDKDTVLKGACNFREQRAGMPEFYNRGIFYSMSVFRGIVHFNFEQGIN